MDDRSDDPLRLAAARRRLAAAEDRGTLLMLGVWGFVAVLAVTAGFASWQYARVQPSPGQSLRDPEATGSITRPGTVARPPATVIDPGRGAASRDIELLRDEVIELRRLLVRAEQKLDAMSQRVTLVEDQTALVAAGLAGVVGAGAPAARAGDGAPEAPRPSRPPPERSGMAPTNPAMTDGQAPPAVAAPSPTATTATVAPSPTAAVAPAPTAAVAPRPPAPLSPTPIAPAPIASTPIAPAPAPQTPPAPVPGAEAPRPPRAMPTVAIGVKPAEADPKPLAAPAAEPIAAPRPDYGVDLGGFRTLAQLRKQWSELDLQQPRLTRGFTPLARVRENNDALEVRLVAGPFPTPADAARYCIQAKAAGLVCAATPYAGQPTK